MTNKRKFEKVSEKQWMLNRPTDVDKHEWLKLLTDLKLPKRATRLSAGYDCYAPFTFTLNPNEEIKLPTGIRASMNDDNFLMALPRSGHGFKYYLRLSNTAGIIDADYIFSENEGHIFVKLRNEGRVPLEIEKGIGMCQLIFVPYLLTIDDESSAERNGGFGSSDAK